MADPELAQAVELAFRVFARRFGPKFNATFEDAGARKLWAHDLHAAGITPALIRRGLAKTRELEWPPALGEFIRICRPTAEELGLPPLDVAYRLACRNEWTHPIVWHAAQRVGPFELRTQPTIQTLPAFRQVYGELLMRAAAGEVFAFPEAKGPALPPPPKETMTGAEARAQLRAWLKRRNPGGDPAP